MADTLDVLTLAEGRLAVNAKADSTQHDETLRRHITAISRLLDDRCGPIVQRTITAELHRGGRCEVFLKRWPVVSVSLVRQASGGTITTVSAVAFGGTGDGYRVDLALGQLTRLGGGYSSAWPAGDSAVEVTYVAGRHATTSVVDARFKDAASAILRRLWKREAGAWAQSSTIFEDADLTAGSGFFRVAAPIINEMLGADQQTQNLLGIA